MEFQADVLRQAARAEGIVNRNQSLQHSEAGDANGVDGFEGCERGEDFGAGSDAGCEDKGEERFAAEGFFEAGEYNFADCGPVGCGADEATR
jgi:hypothetical protein